MRVTRCLCVTAVWRVAGQEGHQLKHVVLDDVTDRTRLLVEASTTFNAKVLGHRYLHGGDVLAIPDWLKEGVRKAEVAQVLHGFFAQVMVDPEDRWLGEDGVEDLV